MRTITIREGRDLIHDSLLTPVPPATDRRMWRRLRALAHPDRHGDHDLFIWLEGVYEHVAGDALEPVHERPHRTRESDNPRVTFDNAVGFDDLIEQALDLSRTLPSPYGGVLALLEDCYEPSHPNTRHRRGCSFKQAAYIAHLVGLTREQRNRWYGIAREIPLADAMAGHIIDRLKGAADGDWSAT